MKGFSVKSFRKTALMLRLYESMKYNLNSTNIVIKLVHRYIVLLISGTAGSHVITSFCSMAAVGRRVVLVLLGH